MVAAIAAEKGVTKGNLVAVAGSKGGLDTTLVVRPTPPSDFSNPDLDRHMAVLEIITMPLK